MKLDIENGKYTFVQREDGACEFYRHDEQWMDIGPGAKAIIAMACELESLRERRDELTDALEDITQAAQQEGLHMSGWSDQVNKAVGVLAKEQS